MIMSIECWWDSAPELIEPQWQTVTAPTKLGPFSGITTNPMLLLDACKRLPPVSHGKTGWDLYLACAVRSADYLTSRNLSIPLCIQLDPRSAFDEAAMLRQAVEIRERIPHATIKVPLTQAGVHAIRALALSGIAVNATWGFSVAQLVAAARAIAAATSTSQKTRSPAVQPRHVLTLMEGRLGDLELRRHLGDEPRLLRGAEGVVFEAAYNSLDRYRDVTTLLASSLRAGPDSYCWHYGTKAGRQVIVTLPPAFLRQYGLPSAGKDYGQIDNQTREKVLKSAIVQRYAAEDGFKEHEFDHLTPLLLTRGEAMRAMEEFENLASQG